MFESWPRRLIARAYLTGAPVIRNLPNVMLTAPRVTKSGHIASKVVISAVLQGYKAVAINKNKKQNSCKI